MGNSTSSMLNMIQGHNITNIKNFGSVFKDELEKKYIKEKDTELKRLTNSKLKIPKIDIVSNAKLSNTEYMFLTKNFVNYFNENNKKRMSYLKKSFGIKYSINGTHFLYFILFFSEFEDFKLSSKAQNIFFLSLSEKEKDFDFTKSIIYSKILGQWASSDVLMGSENEFAKQRFIDIFKDDPIRYVLDDHIIQKVLGNKKYITDHYYERGFPPKEFKTQKPIYYKPNKPVQVKIGNKCLNVNNNKLSFGDCNKTKSKFQFTDSYKLKYNDNQNNCIGFHKNGDMSLVPCDTVNVCNGSNDLQNCSIFKPRKHGGLEIVGKDRKCLTTSKTSGNCYETAKVSFL